MSKRYNLSLTLPDDLAAKFDARHARGPAYARIVLDALQRHLKDRHNAKKEAGK